MWLPVGCVLAPVAFYFSCSALGIPIRPGEKEILRDWVNTGNNEPVGYNGHINRSDPDALYTYQSLMFVKRWPNSGQPIIITNYDRIGGAWLIGPRLRRLVTRVARAEGFPVFPVPFTPWWRVAPTTADTTYELIQRRGRECVFTRTHACETVYFLSGYDRNEWPRLYFLTQLPRPATSIADARQSLKPRSVVLAEQAGRKIFRQGDMFAIPTDITVQQIVDRGGHISPSKRTSLYGTVHTADKIATMPDGTQFAWGHLLHRPSINGGLRNPDHRDLRLRRNRWHLVAKNLTPMRPLSDGRG